ncbi:MAG TPA: FHA domain-containing protein [Dictyobacter sp.]|jgi:pSer/pThr/pTyr-binding forkhead associated (FHA) protein|nr:FHA domain-containing protein [Dictyobacter sp.]
MSGTAHLAEHNEALLVHIADARSPLRIAETLLKAGDAVSIGRQAGVDLLLDEGSVSRMHAQICHLNGRFMVCDLHSSNGTFLNDVRVEADYFYALKPYDVLRFGSIVSFRFLSRSTAGTQPKQPTAQLADPPANVIEPAMTVKTPVPHMVQPAQVVPESGATVKVPASKPESEKEPSLQALPALIVLATAQLQRLQEPPGVYLLRSEQNLTIGDRNGGFDIEMDATTATPRLQARIRAYKGNFYVCNESKTYEISVNKKIVQQPYRLSFGDRIVLGNLLLFFVDLVHQGQTAKVPVALPRMNQPAEQSVRDRRNVPLDPEQSASLPVQRSSIPVVTCEKCGVMNMPVARFCAGCSAPLRTRTGDL